jgi:hypothetical protein
MTSSNPTTWEKTKAMGRTWFEKAGRPVNTLSNKLGAEAFWPTTLDKESDKAARILKSFCIDGFESKQPGEEDIKQSKSKSKALDHIPPEVSARHHMAADI